VQNNVPFYDGDRLCMRDATMLNTGEIVYFGWQARQIPRIEDMQYLAKLAGEAIPRSVVTLKPAVDAGVNVIISDDGPTKTTNMYALANAYLGAAVGSRGDAVQIFVRDLPYDK
jgi:hypothetical protein